MEDNYVVGAFGHYIRVGDTIAYPGRSGSSLWLNEGLVTRITREKLTRWGREYESATLKVAKRVENAGYVANELYTDENGEDPYVKRELPPSVRYVTVTKVSNCVPIRVANFGQLWLRNKYERGELSA